MSKEEDVFDEEKFKDFMEQRPHLTTFEAYQEYLNENVEHFKNMKIRHDVWWLSKKKKEGTITRDEEKRLETAIKLREERLARKKTNVKDCKGFKVITHYPFEDSVKQFNTYNEAKYFVVQQVAKDDEKENSHEIVKCIEEVEWVDK